MHVYEERGGGRILCRAQWRADDEPSCSCPVPAAHRCLLSWAPQPQSANYWWTSWTAKEPDSWFNMPCIHLLHIIPFLDCRIRLSVCYCALWIYSRSRKRRVVLSESLCGETRTLYRESLCRVFFSLTFISDHDWRPCSCIVCYTWADLHHQCPHHPPAPTLMSSV